MCCGKSIAKCLLFAMSFVFWLCGGALLGFGIYLIVDEDATNYFDIATVEVEGVSAQASIILFIILGVFMFVVGFFGCCGTWRESGCMLKTYIALVSVLLVLQIVAGILAIVFQTKIEDNVRNSLNEVMNEKYGSKDYEGLTDAMDFVQFKFECCGTTNGSDWKKWQESDRNEKPEEYKQFPRTCCTLENDDWKAGKPEDLDNCQDADDEYYNEKGCFHEIKDWIDERMVAVIGVAFGIFAIQVIGIFLACCVLQGVKE